MATPNVNSAIMMKSRRLCDVFLLVWDDGDQRRGVLLAAPGCDAACRPGRCVTRLTSRGTTLVFLVPMTLTGMAKIVNSSGLDSDLSSDLGYGVSSGLSSRPGLGPVVVEHTRDRLNHKKHTEPPHSHGEPRRAELRHVCRVVREQQARSRLGWTS